jgi:hypothetical protein
VVDLRAGGAPVARNSAGNLYDVSDGGGEAASGFTAADLEQILSDKSATYTLDLSTTDNPVMIPVESGQGVLGIDLTGVTNSGATVVCEVFGGGIWAPVNMLVKGTMGAFTMSLTQDAQWRGSVAAVRAARLRVTKVGTGEATIYATLSANSSLVQLTASLPPGTNVIGRVGVEGTVAVTGAFYPDVQQVGGTVTANINGTVPVSGTFWPATQPISGTVAVSNFPATQAVSIAAPVQVADSSGSLTVDTGTAGTFALTPAAAASYAIVPSVATPAQRAAGGFVAKASASNLYSATVLADPNGGNFYLLALNRATMPASGAAFTAAEILGITFVYAGLPASISPDDLPDRFGTGITVVCSTSPTTFTPAPSLHLKARFA